MPSVLLRPVVKPPVVKPPVVMPPVVNRPVVKPPEVKPPVVKPVVRLPIKVPVVTRRAAKSPVVNTPPSTNGEGQSGSSPAENGNSQRKPSAAKPKPSSTLKPAPPKTTQRTKVTPAPTKPRSPKVVRFALDEITSNSDSDSSDDPSDDSFTDTDSPATTRTTSQSNLHRTKTKDQRVRKSVRFTPDTKDNEPSSKMDRNSSQTGPNMGRKSSGKAVRSGAPASNHQMPYQAGGYRRSGYMESSHAGENRHPSGHGMPSGTSAFAFQTPNQPGNNQYSGYNEQNSAQGGDKWSHHSSETLVPSGASEFAFLTAKPTSEAVQHPNVAADLTNPARLRSGSVDSAASREPQYAPDNDLDDSWSDSDLASNIDPGDSVFDSDDDDWNVEGWTTPSPHQPIFVFQSTKEAASSTSKPKASSSKRPIPPVFMYLPEGASRAPSSSSRSSAPPQNRLEPVFVYQPTGSSKEPVFVWRPSTDVKKETKATHGDRPAGFDFLPSPAKNVAASPPPVQQQAQPHQQSATTDKTNAANTTSSGRAARGRSGKQTRHSDNVGSRHRRHFSRSANPPSIIHEEDEDTANEPVRSSKRDLSNSWRDV